MNIKLKIKKGDQVIVITGKDKGKKGNVLKVLPSDAKVVVSGVSMYKKHIKPSMQSPGSIQSKEAPIHISNIAHYDASQGKAAKVGYKEHEGKKVRYFKKTNELVM